jgi:putative hydrolase of the HAD superfamily
MAKLRAVLFDLYGTLVDIRTNEYRDDVFESLSRFLEYRRIFIPAQELKKLYFGELNQQIARSREKYPEVDVAEAFSNILRECGGGNDCYLAMMVTQLYRSLTREQMQLFDDTFWTLNEFRQQYRLGIVSDSQRLFCRPELRALRLESFFDAIVSSSDYGFRKPDPRLFHLALAMLDVPPSEAAFIGNSYRTDLIGAKDADFAVVILIHQTEEDKRAYPQGYAPDLIAENLRGALEALSELPPG